jgi:hypothetical protein
MATGNRHGNRRLPTPVEEDLLAAERRRILLRRLLDGDRVVVEDLARAVRAEERGVAAGAIDREERDAVLTDLFERHLPKLLATGVVDYDSMRGTLELRDESLARRAEGRR